MKTPNQTHTYPEGFQAAGIVAGLKVSGKPDLALIYAESGAKVGAVYTKNSFPSVHVQYCRELTPSNDIKAVIINSGNANAATGAQGTQGNLNVVHQLANSMSIQPGQVLTSSTGVIGVEFPDESIVNAIPELTEKLKSEGPEPAAAILTTDLVIKTAHTTIELAGKQYSIYGIAKGSGMIHPNMGTMLAYVMTDAPIPTASVQTLSKELADKSFNRVTVDGDTSTNDTFFLMTSNKENPDHVDADLELALREICVSLAKQIAADGEGAKHLIELEVTGAVSMSSANRVIQKVLTSSLVKTAVHGHDPNWGRLMMATGNAICSQDYGENPPISAWIQDIAVYREGEPAKFDEKQLSLKMQEHLVQIKIDLRKGNAESRGWSCDLSRDYITINADYTT